ncbi:MAG: hypothetical protein AB7E85_09500 [Pseudobdellovibrionaceae bacterium]
MPQDPNMAPIRVTMNDTNRDGNVDRVNLEIGPANNRISVAATIEEMPREDALALKSSWENAAAHPQADREKGLSAAQVGRSLNGGDIYDRYMDSSITGYASWPVVRTRMVRELEITGNEMLDDMHSDANLDIKVVTFTPMG